MCYHSFGRWRLRLAGRPDGVADGRLVTDGGTPDESGVDDGMDSTDGDDSREAGVDEATGESSEGHESDEESDGKTDEAAGASGVDRANVDISEPEGAEPAEPRWEEPDLEDLPEFELSADQPVVQGGAGGRRRWSR